MPRGHGPHLNLRIRQSASFGIGHREEPSTGRASWGRKTQELLQIGPDAYRAEEVQEHHGAVGGIGPGQTAVAHLEDQRDGSEG